MQGGKSQQESPLLDFQLFLTDVSLLMLTARAMILMSIAVLMLSGCYNYLEVPRPMYMRCPTEKSKYLKQAVEIFQHNGYNVTELDTASGLIMVQDSVDSVAWRFTALTRTWKVEYLTDSIRVQVWSVSTRKDGSDVKQTWDKRWSDEIVKDWMRPIMTSLESACGLGSPLTPSPR